MALPAEANVIEAGTEEKPEHDSRPSRHEKRHGSRLSRRAVLGNRVRMVESYRIPTAP